MPIAIGMQQQVQIRAGNGVILWTGCAVVGVMYHVVNTNGATAGYLADGVIQFGEGVHADLTNTVVPRSQSIAATGVPIEGAGATSDLPMSLALCGLSGSAGAGDVAFYGVAVEPIGLNKTGLVVGAGSIVGCLVTTAALTAGFKIGSSATKGAMAAVTSSTTLGTVLGIVIKINTTGATGTNSTSHAGILVNPC